MVTTLMLATRRLSYPGACVHIVPRAAFTSPAA
jgi:hypothetical protein